MVPVDRLCGIRTPDSTFKINELKDEFGDLMPTGLVVLVNQGFVRARIMLPSRHHCSPRRSCSPPFRPKSQRQRCSC